MDNVLDVYTIENNILNDTIHIKKLCELIVFSKLNNIRYVS